VTRAPWLWILGAYHVALGLWQAVDPGGFFDALGPFGAANDHYVRDVASWTLALGATLLVAASRPAWRVPMLAFAALQYGLHALNHLLDIGDADPGWVGVFDFVALSAGTALLAALARREARR
jgi:hypothetical protein